MLIVFFATVCVQVPATLPSTSTTAEIHPAVRLTLGAWMRSNRWSRVAWPRRYGSNRGRSCTGSWVVARFIARFGDRVALLHSALSAGERFDEWRRILDGVADVVVGSRSALFAPLERVGLIVVDEEQEPSYKQESDPRYHAVDTALELGRITGAPVVLGSATPRVVTYEAARKGDLVPLALPERVGELPLPPTTIVDLRLELRTGNRGTLSQALREALQRTVAAGDQAILYLNRRGFATVVLCDSTVETRTSNGVIPRAQSRIG